jgi:hypothetical protein
VFGIRRDFLAFVRDRNIATTAISSACNPGNSLRNLLSARAAICRTGLPQDTI